MFKAANAELVLRENGRVFVEDKGSMKAEIADIRRGFHIVYLFLVAFEALDDG